MPSGRLNHETERRTLADCYYFKVAVYPLLDSTDIVAIQNTLASLCRPDLRTLAMKIFG